ncbi:Galactose-binding-like domain superfamily [Sesbania bispinosa]|nr:Galactose-binding-like domain superfamily [Sesbania bispinosa]
MPSSSMETADHNIWCNPIIHVALHKWEKILTNGTVTGKQYGNSVYLTTYTNNATGEKFCFLSNSHNSQDAEVDLQQDGKYYVPAWSVSILQDCKKEVFNTAKVNTQTTVYVKKPATEGNPLKWVWTSDPMEDTLQGQGTFKASELLEQKGVTVDASDYLWYMTEVVINDTSWQNATLHVTTTGHVLHAYVNGQYIGAQWGKYDNVGFIYEKPIALNQGTNVISLLSGTVGHANYGAFFDLKDTGIVGGPVKLIGSDSNNIIDLTTSTWSYKCSYWKTNDLVQDTFETPEDYGSTLEVNCQGGKTIQKSNSLAMGIHRKCGSFQKEKGGTNGQLAVQLLCDGSNPEDGRVQGFVGSCYI